MLEFFPQCCDAGYYLEEGAACAQQALADGACFGQLRPMGSYLWFSLPYRLGLPAESLILAHLLLLLVSVALSSLAYTRLIAKIARRPTSFQRRKWLHAVSFGGISALVHWVFFYPVIFNSLADAPAAFFTLIAIWLLLLSQTGHRRAMLAASGALLGLAAWIRVFYLYPLFFVLSVFLVLWLLDRKRRLGELVFLVALIPVLVQFIVTFQQSGQVSYVGTVQTSQLTDFHLGSTSMGYDTLVFPTEGHHWPSNCEVENGLIGAWERRDLSEAVCLLGKKAQFYFGSYSPRTYLSRADPASGDLGERIRTWSVGFLALNILAMLSAVWLIVKSRRVGTRGGLVAMLLPVLVLGEALMIIPEQRFMMVFHVSVWIALLASAMMFFTEFRRRARSAATRTST